MTSNAINWNFKKHYVQAGYTLAGLGARSKISKTFLCMFARGKYNLNHNQLNTIANILGVSKDDIAA